MEAFPNKNINPYDLLPSCSTHSMDPVDIFGPLSISDLSTIELEPGFLHTMHRTEVCFAVHVAFNPNVNQSLLYVLAQ